MVAPSPGQRAEQRADQGPSARGLPASLAAGLPAAEARGQQLLPGSAPGCGLVSFLPGDPGPDPRAGTHPGSQARPGDPNLAQALLRLSPVPGQTDPASILE